MALVNTRQYLNEALVEGCLQVPSQNTALSFRDSVAAHCCSEGLPQGQQSPESQPCHTVLAASWGCAQHCPLLHPLPLWRVQRGQGEFQLLPACTEPRQTLGLGSVSSLFPVELGKHRGRARQARGLFKILQAPSSPARCHGCSNGTGFCGAVIDFVCLDTVASSKGLLLTASVWFLSLSKSCALPGVSLCPGKVS